MSNPRKLTTCRPAVPSATKAMPPPSATLKGSAGRMNRVRNPSVLSGLERSTTSKANGTAPPPPGLPTVTPSPEPFATIALPAMELSSTPLSNVRSFGSDTSTVANPAVAKPAVGFSAAM